MKTFIPILFIIASCFNTSKEYPEVGKIEVLDPAMNKLFNPNAKVQILGEGMKWAEGPVWVKKGNYLLCSDPSQNNIYKWNEKEGLTQFLNPSGYEGSSYYSSEPGTNGLIINQKGDLIACDHGNRRISSISLDTKKKTSLIDKWEGKKFNSPNDICQHPDGSYFFTDPPYGLPDRESDTKNKEIAQNGVYHLDKNRNVRQIVSDLARPNGIALSPDAKKLYVALSDGSNPYIMQYTLDKGSVKGKGEIFIDFRKSFPNERLAADGFKFDRAGNLYAAAGDGVIVFNKSGKAIGRVRAGIHTANCAIGADGYMYLTSTDKLLRVKMGK